VWYSQLVAAGEYVLAGAQLVAALISITLGRVCERSLDRQLSSMMTIHRRKLYS